MLHLSGALRKEMGLKDKDVLPEAHEDGFLRNWYAHMFYIKRKKCVIFVNADTFYTCAVFLVDRKQIKDLEALLSTSFQKSLYEHGFAADIISRAKSGCTGLKYAKTSDRRMTGLITEFVKSLRYIVDYEGYETVQELENDAKRFLQWPLFASTRNSVWPIREFCKYCGIGAKEFFEKYSEIDRPITEALIESY